MEVFAKYLAGIDNPEHCERTEEILAWVANKFPNLESQIKWNTPMFSDHVNIKYFIKCIATVIHWFLILLFLRTLL